MTDHPDTLTALKIRLFVALNDKSDQTAMEEDLMLTLSVDPDVAVWAMEHPEAFIDD